MLVTLDRCNYNHFLKLFPKRFIYAIYHYISRRTCPHIHRSLPSQNPHKDKLHNVRVDEQELRPTVALRTCHGMHGAGAHGGVAGRVGEQDVFQ